MISNKIRKILAVAMIVVMGAVSVGCTSEKVSESGNEGTVVDSSDKNESNEEDTKANEDVENEESNNDKPEEENSGKDESIVFELYSKDLETDRTINAGHVEIKKNSSLEEKLTELANTLSTQVFKSLPLKLTEIKEVDGKKIAIFDFKEDKNLDVTWLNNFFAGSAGGSATETALEKTLLQRDYKEEWIDGIEFTYEGGKVEFDHVPNLGETIYR